MDSIIIRKQIAQQKAIERIQIRQANTINRTSFNQPAFLTLTRTNTLSITTAGTIITWELETRNNGFTWASSDITIPTTGYYGISCMIYSSATNFSTWFTLGVNSNAVGFMTTDSTAVNRHTAFTQRYFTAGDVINITLTPNINFTLNVVAENSANESPMLHLVQLTGVTL
jgi:hypothetical protein